MGEIIGKFVGIVAIIVFLVPIFMVMGAFMGGVAGVIVGWFFPFIFDAFRELSGLSYTNFQLGATLGVFGSAFRSHSFSKD